MSRRSGVQRCSVCLGRGSPVGGTKIGQVTRMQRRANSTPPPCRGVPRGGTGPSHAAVRLTHLSGPADTRRRRRRRRQRRRSHVSTNHCAEAGLRDKLLGLGDALTRPRHAGPPALHRQHRDLADRIAAPSGPLGGARPWPGPYGDGIANKRVPERASPRGRRRTGGDLADDVRPGCQRGSARLGARWVPGVRSEGRRGAN